MNQTNNALYGKTEIIEFYILIKEENFKQENGWF